MKEGPVCRMFHEMIATFALRNRTIFPAACFASAWNWRSGLTHGLKSLHQGDKYSSNYSYKLLNLNIILFFFPFYFSVSFSLLPSLSLSYCVICQLSTGPFSATDTVFLFDIAKRIVKILSGFYIIVCNRKWHVFLGLSNKAQRAPGCVETAGCALVSLCTSIIPLVLDIPWVFKIFLLFLKSLVN